MNKIEIAEGGDVFVNKHHVGWVTSKRTEESAESEALDHRDHATIFHRLKDLPKDEQMRTRAEDTVTMVIPHAALERTGYLEYGIGKEFKRNVLLFIGA